MRPNPTPAEKLIVGFLVLVYPLIRLYQRACARIHKIYIRFRMRKERKEINRKYKDLPL